MKVNLILIDAMNLIRRIYAVQERPFLLLDELSDKTKVQIIHNTKLNANKALQKILNELKPTHALAVFDCKNPCWRYQLFADYKKGRKQMPTHLQESLVDIQDGFLELGVDSLESENDEADDLIATLAVKVALRGQHTTIISTDKGYLPILGQNIDVYDYFNKRYMDEEYVRNKFSVKSSQLIDYWTMTGDNTNKIPGVTGIGPVTAADLLQQYGSLNAILAAEDLKKSLKRKFTECHDQIQISQQLLNLKKDIPLGFNLKDIRLEHEELTLD
ncbi:flap endonuclease Xni [Thalassotalea aquiviva]|uniref:flap endonuclease Xni n=1 Tax=Thalassotalea aquiviva TaxID=3242415 RepID=UPI00352B8F4C